MSVTVSANLAANEVLDRRRRNGEPVLPLAFGEAGLPVHPSLKRELAAAADRNAYGQVAGSAALREAAAGYWRRRGLAADPGHVVAGPGSKPLLYGLLLAIGGDVVVPRPSWVSYAAQADLVGVRPLFVTPASGQGGVPDPELLREAVTRTRSAGRDVRSIIVTLPDNPTGSLPGPEVVRELCATARDLDLMIIADEIYRDVVFDGSTPYTCPATLAPERTVITTGLSKSLALGGWRTGVALLPDSAVGNALLTKLLGIVSHVWSSSPGPIQQAAAYAFTEPPELTGYIASARRLHAKVLLAMTERFRAAGATAVTPQGGFYLYPDFEDWREHLADGHGVTTGDDLARLLLDRYGVGVVPGSAFGDSAEALRFRVATSMLYGETDVERRAALAAPDPLALPWIRDALTRATEVLTDLRSASRHPIAA